MHQVQSLGEMDMTRYKQRAAATKHSHFCTTGVKTLRYPSGGKP